MLELLELLIILGRLFHKEGPRFSIPGFPTSEENMEGALQNWWGGLESIYVGNMGSSQEGILYEAPGDLWYEN